MAKKSSIINGGFSGASESYNSIYNKIAYGTEEYKITNDVAINSVVVNKDATPFDPKALDMQEWCPVYCLGKNNEGGNVYLCSISANITYTHEYVQLLNCLHSATNKDTIELNINSPGGYISTATQICTAIKHCQAEVYTHATGICASAGSLIWSVGDIVSVGDTANFMWHMSSHMDFGNSLAIADEAEFQVNYVKSILLSISLKRGFITEDEVAMICNNPDHTVWVSAATMRERICAFNNRDLVAGGSDE